MMNSLDPRRFSLHGRTFLADPVVLRLYFSGRGNDTRLEVLETEELQEALRTEGDPTT